MSVLRLISPVVSDCRPTIRYQPASGYGSSTVLTSTLRAAFVFAVKPPLGGSLRAYSAPRPSGLQRARAYVLT
ncbi:hypothetical protein B5X24_HaOG211949 [Helicoverpa armigera]|uniref:Uncharacterized protein n=1 Tax=Helicoverpa armigera TaxID=29058 RepID=A0A2W1B8I1_HELAM|nr:hypothetical protein B5X24_HaOG211949 [Helicoverpa armigera]